MGAIQTLLSIMGAPGPIEYDRGEVAPGPFHGPLGLDFSGGAATADLTDCDAAPWSTDQNAQQVQGMDATNKAVLLLSGVEVVLYPDSADLNDQDFRDLITSSYLQWTPKSKPSRYLMGPQFIKSGLAGNSVSTVDSDETTLTATYAPTYQNPRALAPWVRERQWAIDLEFDTFQLVCPNIAFASTLYAGITFYGALASKSQYNGQSPQVLDCTTLPKGNGGALDNRIVQVAKIVGSSFL